jgi:hypothetical protein
MTGSQGAKSGSKRPRKAVSKRPDRTRRKPGQDPVAKFVKAAVALLTELYKLGREMVAIPVHLWMMLAEVAGAAVLGAWRFLRPILVAALRLLAKAERAAERRLTPKRAVVGVTIAVLVLLVVSQWSDYREISVGNFAYSGGVQDVAPAPDVATDRAGVAHDWVLIPIAVVGLVLVGAAIAGRWRAGRLLAGLGVAVIAISLLVDVPKGLDEGSAAVAYEGAKASLLEGFWVQIVCGAAMICCGLLLSAHSRPEGAAAKRARRPRLRGGTIKKRLRLGRPAAGSSA